MKFKKGDKVKIVDTWENSEGRQEWSGDMNKWLGKTMTIRRTLDEECYKMEEDKSEYLGDGWYWYDSMIEGLARHTGVFYKGDKVKINGEATITGYQDKQDGGIKYNTSSGGTFEESELTLIEGKDEDKPRPQELQLYCVKDYSPGTLLTKGKIYKFDGRMTYDDGRKGGKHASWEDYKNCAPELAARLYPLFKRQAKKGESMLVVNSDDWQLNEYQNGDVLLCYGDSAYNGFVYCDSKYNIIKQNEYLVLDGYKPEPEKPKYYNGKVVCVKGDEYHTKGKVYEVVDGELPSDGCGMCINKFRSLDEINDICTPQFIELIEN